MGFHVVVDQTIGGKNVGLDCLNCDSVLVRQDSAAEREETAPMSLTGRVKTRNGSCVRGRGGELIHGTTAAWGMVEPTAASDRVGKGIEQIGLSTHSTNRVTGIDQAAEVVFKVGAEKDANGQLSPSPKR